MEIWKDIPWYEWLYKISNLGRIKSLTTRWWKKPWIMYSRNKGWWYMDTMLTNIIWKRKTFTIHRLVVSAFLWFDITTKIKDWVIMHLDNNPSNNNIDNLKIWTQSENTKQCIKEWRWEQFKMKWEKHNLAKLNNEQVLEIRKLHLEWLWYRKIGKIYNMSYNNIWDIIKRKIWKHI